MYKSGAIKLVLLQSVLALAGCSRTCDPEENKKDQDNPQAQTSCRGSRHHGGGGVFFHGGGYRGGASRPGTSVGRGGFGSTGHAVS